MGTYGRTISWVVGGAFIVIAMYKLVEFMTWMSTVAFK